jgi:Ala-tRNA(Pro) deacylase
MMTELEFLTFLDNNNFIYQRVEHPAVFTCEEAELHRPDVSATSTKNLFLCDKKARRFFLAVTSCEKTVKLDTLASQLGIKALALWLGEKFDASTRCHTRGSHHDGVGKRR